MNRESLRISVPIETTTSNALISCNCFGGYDWSDQAEEGPTNYALMAYSYSSSNYEFILMISIVSKSCLETVKTLKSQYDQLHKDFKKSELMNASKSLDKLIDSQIVDNCKKGLDYNAVPPPYTGNFMPPTPDLSFTGLEEFTSEPVVIKPIVENSEAMASEAKPKAVRKNNDAPIIKDWVSDSEEEDVPQAKIEKKTVKPSFAKIEFVKPKGKTAWKTAKRVEQIRQNTHIPRGNQRNWNNMMSQRLGITTARQVNAAYSKTTVNAAKPKSYLSKTAHSTVKRPIHKNTTFKNKNFNQRVNTVKDKNVNTVRSKAVVNAARPKAVVNVVKGNNVNVGNPQMDLQDKGVIDSGCSRHMTGNMSYLTNYEEIDGGYVAFGENPKGGKIQNGRLGHLNFKTMNKLVKGNLVRGLPSKLFENDETYVACQKGKQHRASCKSKTKNSISLPLHLLHMDLFGPTFVKILMKKMYCLVVTDDYSRFTWVFFLTTKDETSGIIKSFITGIENLVDRKVKVIRCDNGTEFKNKEMNQFCEKGYFKTI
ncbi:putative ribonuclease H-like domain-containing protein [Tanacetum coccineum]